MNELFVRILFSGLFSLSLAVLLFLRIRSEETDRNGRSYRQKYAPYIHGSLLPSLLLVALFFSAVSGGPPEAARFLLTSVLGIFFHITIYYLLLIPAIPFFRRSLNARTCAVLWMIPGCLYITDYRFMELPAPLVIIRAAGTPVRILFFLWIAGVFLILIWKTAEHFCFRRRILRHAVAVTDPAVLSVWQNVLLQSRMDFTDFPLVVSPEVKAPLSVGLFRFSTCVVLPDRSYPPEELELIFRHETVHIARADSWSKFFLLFCTAMCWFHPLMWIAMKKSAEDLELSCDETVLLREDDDTRRKYALLLLNTAGDGRGFTTCLSSSASAMRYRLKSIAAPVRRRSGILLLALVSFLLFITSGYVSLAYGGKSGNDLIYGGGEISSFDLTDVFVTAGKKAVSYEIDDEEAFLSCLSRMTFSQLTGNYTFSSCPESLHCTITGPDGTVSLSLHGRTARIRTGRSGWVPYYIEEADGWEQLTHFFR